MPHSTVASLIGASVLLSACVAPHHASDAAFSGAPRSAEATELVPNTPSMPNIPSHRISFETTEGTWMNVDVSPDGESMVFDLLGDIYALPIAGGDAVPMTSGRAWDQAPRYSPDGRHVYFVSDREGYKNIWRLTLADQSVQQITRADSDVRGGPNWSHDRRHLLVGVGDAATRNSEVTLQFIDPNSGSMMPIEQHDGPWIDWDTFERLRQQNMRLSAVQAANDQVYFSEGKFEEDGRKTVRMYKFDIRTQTRTPVTPEDATYSEFKPQLSHDGNLLAYFRQYGDRRTEVRILNVATGQDEALAELENPDNAEYTLDDDSRPNYAFTPDDRYVVFWHGGKIHRVSLADGSSEIIPFRVEVSRSVWARVEPAVQYLSGDGEAAIARWPSMSHDGRTMSFAAIGYVWIRDMQTGRHRRLTDSNDFEYMPTLSPDGKSVAYISFEQIGDEYGSGRLMLANIEDGSTQELLASENDTYLIPKWSPDGQKIAIVRESESDSGRDASYGWTTPAADSVFNEVAQAPSSTSLFGLSVYARSVGFDGSNQRLVFSHPTSKTETVLVAASLDGNNSKTLAVSDVDVGGISAAPDLKHLALTRHDGSVWLTPFMIGEEPSVVSTLMHGARRVSTSGGYYVDWTRSNEFTYGFGQNVYRYRLGQDESEETPIRVRIAQPRSDQPIAFVGARIITMSGADSAGVVIESGTIVLQSQRIVAVGPVNEVPIPAGAVAIDGTGKTIMPGLLDTHYHRIGGSGGLIGVSAFKLPNPAFNNRSAITYGITTAWEPGGVLNDGAPATADLQRAGRILGPRWSYAAAGGVGSPYEMLTTYADARAAVEQHRILGVTVLKEYLAPTRAHRQWLSVAAREKGVGIVSHLESFDGTMTRVVDGYTGGDHPYIPVPFFKDVQELLRQTGYIWTPNLVITPDVQGSGSDKFRNFCRAFSDWKRRTNSSMNFPDSVCGSSVDDATASYETHRISRVAEQAASAARGGVHIGVSAHNMPGSNLHLEMWYLWKGGMPIEDVLRATTIGNAEKLGLQEEIGSLEVGKMADFLVLDENPLDDILSTLSLKYTVQGGVVYDSATAERIDVSMIAEAANDADAAERKTGTDN